jgi:hypothetical protein
MRQQLHKKKVNRIVSLKDANGAVCSSLDELNVIAIAYFRETHLYHIYL